VAEAIGILTGASTVTDRNTGVTFAKLPVAPTAYCNLSLFAPLDAPLRWPDDLAILFNFTSDRTGTRNLQMINHWGRQVPNPWLLMLEGPVNPDTNQYEMRTDRSHEWADCISAGVRVLEEFARGRGRVACYFNCPVALSFEIGLRTKVMNGPRRVYHFDTAGGIYHTAINSWPT